ncbi:unnamed protein product [Didymodactylos carnosus]|uniref:Senescence domain-containing protein n=1 Tax=Didymodactylos carnosus TaxID=1234261 RepID=A0A815GDF7_9BILA|nr:unnamed protein product [Didymodactylos carnosus]CAF1337193.1 unnamed protein product [Didymodactylos carnosus]CAF3988507.1 unnamed protein product [Didymodactylos carnosus]CAF4195412.1 unnamed protein product [Didymodactylos carnosus]
MSIITAEKPTSGGVKTPTLKDVKHEANNYLNRAKKLENDKNYEEATVLYKRVISLIQNHENDNTVDEQSAKELDTLKRNATQNLMQTALHSSPPSAPVYVNMIRQLSNHVQQPFNEQDLTEMGEQVFSDETAFEPVVNNHEAANAAVLFELERGAKLFYMAADGKIETTSDTLPLSIFEMSESTGETCGLLKLGSWIYPLNPKVSPAFKTSFDAYLFPNNTSVGEFVGLMFDEKISPDTIQYFEDVLSKYSVFMAQPNTPTYGESLTATTTSSATAQGEKIVPVSKQTEASKVAEKKKGEIIGEEEVAIEDESLYDTSTATGKLAGALVTGTKFLTKQLATGVIMAENLINKASIKVHDSLVPSAEPVKVHADYIVIFCLIVSKVGAMTLGLARTFAPQFGRVQKKKNADGTEEIVKLSGIRGIGHAGLTSFSVAYESCENAAKHLAKSLANESVSVVKHKYGDDASILTENAMYAVGNTALTTYYVGGLGPKAIARRVVKQTAKETAKNALNI